MGSKISNTEWGLLIGAAIMLDLTEWILDAFGIGFFFNPPIDFVLGLAQPFYFKMRGVKMDSKKILTWVGGGAIETFLAGALPMWTAEIVIIMLMDKLDKKVGGLVNKVEGKEATTPNQENAPSV